MTKIICLTKNIRQVTSGIFYCRNSVDLSVSASNKLSCNLTGKYFEVGNKNIPPNRYPTFENQIEMKVKFKHLGIFFFVLITIQSCKPDDVYHDLSDDAKDFLLFEIDDTFKLKNLETDEIITLTITSKEIGHYEDGPNESSFISFGPSADIYIERGEYIFTDDTNCYDGIVAVEANRDGGFELQAYLGNCFGDIDYSFQYQDEFFTTIDVEGIEYSNAYLLRSFPDILFYSKEKGILKIVNDFNQETRFTIVE